MLDVAIIGGGLAGLAAAIRLSQFGWQVALFESKSYPMHRVCGEFMSPECVTTLDTLGVMPTVRDQQPNWMNQARVTTPSGSEWSRALPGTAMGISRYTIDKLLVNQARDVGAVVHEAHTVRNVQGSLRDGFTLTISHAGAPHTVQARTVLSAHGKRSNLDRTLKRDFIQRRQPFVGLKTHLRGERLPNRVELHTFEGGYCGLNEVENGIVNACLLVREDVFRSAGAVEPFVAWMSDQNPALGTWLASTEPVLDHWLSISQIPFEPKTAVEGDLLLTGDAAGLIAPLAGNGMGMALDGGVLAAQHLHHYLRRDHTSERLKHDYARDWSAQFGGRLQLGRFLQNCMLRTDVMRVGVAVLNRVPALGGYFVNHTRAHA